MKVEFNIVGGGVIGQINPIDLDAGGVQALFNLKEIKLRIYTSAGVSTVSSCSIRDISLDASEQTPLLRVNIQT
ncbi:hypothetical protein [Tumebacillus avium]|uniref:hypothetical protein n=1 Tax=Tumebacillus avium TaxID=1903704 RepID=UPI0012FD221B|nr:hypothetical protein [Tumebacillus avium]